VGERIMKINYCMARTQATA